jgi:N-acetylglutamate synthase-like GNAT family acetyltransferase
MKADIVETVDYKIFKELAEEFNLEVFNLGSYVKAWVLVVDGKNVGAVSIKRLGDIWILDIVAVKKGLQGKAFGRQLMEKALDYARKKRVKRLYLDTQVPSFFEKFGFRKIQKEEAPKVTECWKCEQYGKTCFPTHMVWERDRKTEESSASFNLC